MGGLIVAMPLRQPLAAWPKARVSPPLRSRAARSFQRESEVRRSCHRFRRRLRRARSSGARVPLDAALSVCHSARRSPRPRMTFFNGRRDRLDAFRLGDRAALAEVFHSYVDDVSQLLRNGFRLDARRLVVRGISDAEREKELVQEVFLRAFAPRARLAYNALLPYRPYLLQISRNLLVDEWRKRGLIVAEVSSEELESAPALELAADEELEVRKLRAATSAWCQSLSAELREFIRLRFEVGLSQAELAAQLRVSRRQVRTWEAHVQDGLKSHLEELGLTED